MTKIVSTIELVLVVTALFCIFLETNLKVWWGVGSLLRIMWYAVHRKHQSCVGVAMLPRWRKRQGEWLRVSGGSLPVGEPHPSEVSLNFPFSYCWIFTPPSHCLCCHLLVGDDAPGGRVTTSTCHGQSTARYLPISYCGIIYSLSEWINAAWNSFI